MDYDLEITDDQSMIDEERPFGFSPIPNTQQETTQFVHGITQQSPQFARIVGSPQKTIILDYGGSSIIENHWSRNDRNEERQGNVQESELSLVLDYEKEKIIQLERKLSYKENIIREMTRLQNDLIQSNENLQQKLSNAKQQNLAESHKLQKGNNEQSELKQLEQALLQMEDNLERVEKTNIVLEEELETKQKQILYYEQQIAYLKKYIADNEVQIAELTRYKYQQLQTDQHISCNQQILQLTQQLKEKNHKSRQADITERRVIELEAALQEALRSRQSTDRTLHQSRSKSASRQSTVNHGSQRIIEPLLSILNIDSSREIVKQVRNLVRQQRQYQKTSKFIDKVTNLVIECSPPNTYEQQLSLKRIWRWIRRLIEEYLNIKKENQQQDQNNEIISKSLKILNLKSKDEITKKLRVLTSPLKPNNVPRAKENRSRRYN